MGDDCCQCKNCKFFDPEEKDPDDSLKRYCDWYRAYEDPDEIRKCPHYSEK